MRLLYVLVLLGLVASCRVTNPAFCDDSKPCSDGLVCNLETNGCETGGVDASETTDDGANGVDAMADAGPDSMPDALGSCSSNTHCPMPEAPVCDATDQTCRVCELDQECGSGVCRDDGTCEVSSNILYASPTGTGNACVQTSPCTITQAKQLLGPKKIVHLADGIYELSFRLDLGAPADGSLFVGSPAAVIRCTMAGPSILIAGALVTFRGMTFNRGVRVDPLSALTVQRATFTNAGSDQTPWIDNRGVLTTIEDSVLNDAPTDAIRSLDAALVIARTQIKRAVGSGIVASNSATGSFPFVRITSCDISNNTGFGVTVSALSGATIGFTSRQSTFYQNGDGGIDARCAGAQYELTNNLIGGNGDTTSEFGGVRVSSTNSNSKFFHNTIAFNKARNGSTLAGGIHCTGPAGNNNLIYSNFVGTSASAAANTQTAGTCTHGMSLISNGTMLSNEMHFVSTSAPYNLHLADAGSPAANVGALSTINVDVDNETRPNGAPDVGGDELH